MNKTIYLDHASTTKVDQEVLDVYTNAVSASFANPSSVHLLGQQALRELDKCRESILRLLNLNDHQVIFLSGATEANNLAIKGVCLKYQNRGKHIVTSIYEHPSVLEAFKQLETEFDFEVSYLYPNESGVITVDTVKSAIRKDTIFVSIMAVNNEIGVVNPIEDIAKVLKEFPKVIFHTDACQAVGKMNKSINFKDVDLITLSSHKIHGPVGTGALLKRKKIELLSLNSGGGQEYNFRSGTNDLAGALAFKKALEISLKEQSARFNHVKELSEIIIDYLAKHKSDFELNSTEPINPYIINFSSINKKGSVIVEALSNYGVMVSSVSACHSSKEKGSYVVKSLGKSDKAVMNTIRVSLDYTNTKEEILEFLSILDKVIGEIR